MRVKGTYFLGREDANLEDSLKEIKELIKEDSNSITLTNDEDELVAKAVDAFIEDDHIVIEYEADSFFEEELIKEGFII